MKIIQIWLKCIKISSKFENEWFMFIYIYIYQTGGSAAGANTQHDIGSWGPAATGAENSEKSAYSVFI
jgi:hypothetical protein